MLVTSASHKANDAATTDSLTAVNEYVTSRGLMGAVPVSIAQQLGISARATPTLLTYNSDGIVTGSWIGLLNAKKQEQVLASIKNN